MRLRCNDFIASRQIEWTYISTASLSDLTFLIHSNQVVLFIIMMIVIVVADLTLPTLFEDFLNLLHLVISERRELFRARAR